MRLERLGDAHLVRVRREPALGLVVEVLSRSHLGVALVAQLVGKLNLGLPVELFELVVVPPGHLHRVDVVVHVVLGRPAVVRKGRLSGLEFHGRNVRPCLVAREDRRQQWEQEQEDDGQQ